MKPIYWILIIVLILGLAGGGFWFYTKNQKKKISTGLDKSDKKDSKPDGGGQTGTETVRQLQQRLNLLLPDTHPKLQVDGIYGERTKAAEKLVLEMQKSGGLRATDKTVTTPQGTVTINTNSVIDTVKGLAEVAVKTNPLYQAGKFFTELF